ncbi:MAG: nucleoside triphosphate pyrophosphohydrolase [Planctomycetes bacterium]|nr:nucleoside triphosphate pyrophosphohydrolase [Planctomycetota bacterium]
MNSQSDFAKKFLELVETMARLRSPAGCPWDRQQTHESLKRYLLEETYELLEAIDEGEPGAICDELGDVFLQLVFHAQIASEGGQFDVGDSLGRICKKLRHRHPHVFGEEKAETPDDVTVIWQRQKAKEGRTSEDTSALANVPKSMPALARAQELQRKAGKVGFDWPGIFGVLDKLQEETLELKKAITEESSRQRAEELGDILFTVVNLCRFLSVEAEEAAHSSCRKFEKRFREVERLAATQGRRLEDMSLKELDVLWEQSKNKYK